MTSAPQDPNPQWRTDSTAPGQARRGGLGAGAIVAIVLGAVLAFVLVAGAAFFVIPRLVNDSTTVELRAEPVSSAVAAFTPPVGTDTEPAEPVARTGVQPVPAGTAGLYGGTLDQASCDKDQLVAYLTANPDLARAWSSVLGLTATDIPGFVAPLTPVLLRSDTAVTNHGYLDGKATAVPAVLQAGTAVLVNSVGEPVVKCYCGNPLTPPPAELTGARVTGTTWPAFRPESFTVVEPSRTTISTFVLVDVRTGEQFVRTAGTAGTDDRSETPQSQAPATPATPAPQPTPTTPATPQPAPPAQEGGREGDAITLVATRLDECQIQILGDATDFVPVLEDPDLSFQAAPTGSGPGLYGVQMFVADGGVYTWTVNVDSGAVVPADEASAGLQADCPGVFD